MAKPRDISDKEAERIKVFLSYDTSTGLFTWKRSKGKRIKAGNVAGSKDVSGYIKMGFDGKDVYAHRLAFLFMNKSIPKYVDHINGVRSDNRWCNLRPCSQSQNISNSKKSSSNTSGYKGVSWAKKRKKWEVSICVNYKQIHLGYFDCPKDAYKAYCEAADKYHKEYKNYG